MSASTLAERTPSTLSWSKVSKFSECGERYRLSYALGMRGHTWYATLAGSAIHEITEYADRREFEGIPPEDQLNGAPTFQEAFDRRISEALAEGKTIKASGKVLKSIGKTGGPNKKDYDWWIIYGPQFIQMWMDWKSFHGWHIATMPDGLPGIEIGFQVDINIEDDPNVPDLVGYIDRVYVIDTPVGPEYLVLDLKSGQMATHSLQLKTYSVGLEKKYGIHAPYGIMWSPGSSTKVNDEDMGFGGVSKMFQLDNISTSSMEKMYLMAWKGIANGVFVPHPSNMCVGCDMSRYCWAYEGPEADMVPQPSVPTCRECGYEGGAHQEECSSVWSPEWLDEEEEVED